MAKERVLIVGAGFGGIKAALALKDSEQHEVTVLSERLDFRYYPTLYRVALGTSKENASISLSKLFADTAVNVKQGVAVSVDRKAKTVKTQDGQAISYDVLILGLGVVTNYFGIPGLPEFSYSIKSMADVERFKHHLHQQLIDTQQPDLNYVIVGAGPTGIELAGSLPEYLRQIMHNHGIKHRAIHIDLVEAAPRLLPRMPRDTSRMVKRRLKRLGITVLTSAAVQGETADELIINGKPVRSHTVVWTAGVTNHPFFAENKFALTNRGKVSVDAYLQAEDNVYVIGDNANTPYSGMAQTAIHDAEFVAENIILNKAGKERKSYVVKRPVTVIPVGDRWAAVLWGSVRMYGWLGWTLREMADVAGFHDYQSWTDAGKQWLTEFTTEESCPVCVAATAGN